MHRIGHTCVVGYLLIGCKDLLRCILAGLDPYPPGQHRDLRASRLQAYFKLGAQYPCFTPVGIHYKGLAGVGDVKKGHAAAQLHMALTATEIHRNGAVGIQRDLRLIGQHHSANLPRRTHIVRAQIVHPARRLPTGKHTDHQQQTRGNRQPARPMPQAAAPGLVHCRQVTLHGQRLFVGQGGTGHLAQLPHHLGLGIGLGVGRVSQQPATESGLIAAVRLIVQHTEPCQCGALLLGSNGNS